MDRDSFPATAPKSSLEQHCNHFNAAANTLNTESVTLPVSEIGLSFMAWGYGLTPKANAVASANRA